MTYTYQVKAIDFSDNTSSAAFASATTFDTVAPSAPGGLTAAAVSGSQINLSWPASSDNVGVSGYLVEMCAGAGCGNFTQIAGTGATNHSVTGLANGTLYSFRVRGYDAVPNYGGYSPVGSATTFDTVAPSAPGALAASAASDTQVNLSWSASSDNVGVNGYLIERCHGSGCSNFANIATTSATSYSNTGLTPATAYSYRVRASDAAANYSDYSGVASAATPDTLAPSAPASLAATAVSTSQIDLSWTASSDNVAVTGYLIERCQGAACSDFTQVVTTTATSHSNTGLTSATTYRYRVRARDAASNYSGYSAIVSAITPSDTQAPSTPTSLSGAAVSGTQINLSWAASTDNEGVTGYSVERCQGATCTAFAQIATPTTTSYSNTGLTNGTAYRYRIRARDAAANYSSYTSIVTVTTLDTQAPTAPSGLTGTVASSTQINLSWTASGDNVGVTGYLIERCQGPSCTNFVQIATVTATTYSNSGVSSGATYRYRVRARDAVPNYSDYAGPVTIVVDTQPPTAPTSLVVTAESNPLLLSWNASTDNIGVTAYLIERCHGEACSSYTQIGTSTTPSYTDSISIVGESYSYRVRARDAAGNLSGYSNEAAPCD